MSYNTTHNSAPNLPGRVAKQYSGCHYPSSPGQQSIPSQFMSLHNTLHNTQYITQYIGPMHNTLHNTHYTIYCTIPITQYIKQYPMQDPQNSQYSMQDSISHSWGSIPGRHPTVKLQWWSSSVQLLHHLHHHYQCHHQPCVFDLCSQYIVSHPDSNGGIYTDYLVGRNRKIQFVFTDRKVAPFVSIQWLYTFTTYMRRN